MCCHNVFRRVGKAIKKGARKIAKVVLPLTAMSLTGGGAFGSLASIGKGAGVIAKGAIGSIGGVVGGISGSTGGVDTSAYEVAIKKQNQAIETQNEYIKKQGETLKTEREKTRAYLNEINNQRADNMAMQGAVVNAQANKGSTIPAEAVIGGIIYALARL